MLISEKNIESKLEKYIIEIGSFLDIKIFMIDKFTEWPYSHHLRYLGVSICIWTSYYSNDSHKLYLLFQILIIAAVAVTSFATPVYVQREPVAYAVSALSFTFLACFLKHFWIQELIWPWMLSQGLHTNAMLLQITLVRHFSYSFLVLLKSSTEHWHP